MGSRLKSQFSGKTLLSSSWGLCSSSGGGGGPSSNGESATIEAATGGALLENGTACTCTRFEISIKYVYKMHAIKNSKTTQIPKYV